MTKQAHIFLSYADADRKFVSKIASELTKIGVLSYGLKLEAGGKIFGKIKKELTSADLFVFVVPSQEGEGRWALAAACPSVRRC